MNPVAAELWKSLRKNRGAMAGLVIFALVALLAAAAPWVAPYDPAQIHEGMLRLTPSWSANGNAAHWLGTDDLGRDLASRLVHGARVSIGIGLLAAFLSAFFGTLVGLVAGYRGGWVDTALMRGMDILLALPSLLLAIVVVSILGPSLVNAITAVAIVSVPHFARLVRGAVLGEKSKLYVEASASFGASPWRQVFRNILPNISAPVIVQAAFAFSEGILNAAGLGFLGLGAQPPTPEWGTMLSDARAYIQSTPHLVTLPGMCILILVLACNLLGDGIRDALDPRLKRL